MSVALKLYEQLTEAGEDNKRARLHAEAFELLVEQIEDRYPAFRDIATQRHLSECELRLQKEIEAIKLETESVKFKIKETEGLLKLELKEIEGRIQKEIEAIKQETESIKSKIKETEGKLRLEIKETEGRIQKEIRETEGRLNKDIEGVRKDIEGVRLEIKSLEVKMVSMLHNHTLWIIGSIGAVGGLLKALDHFFK